MTIKETVNLVLAVSFEFIFPSTCFLCCKPGELVCAKCTKRLEPAQNRCIKCSRNNPLGLTCRACLSKTSPEYAWSRFAYTRGSKKLIQQYKYHDAASLKSFFADETYKIVAEINNLDKYHLQAIPIHKNKRRYRGYNQAELVAKEINSKYKVPLTDSLVRVEASISQAQSRSKHQREINIRGAFKIKGRPPSHVILLDDVITTGSTMREAAKILKKAGCRSIVCISIAR
jgi:ComF family protein